MSKDVYCDFGGIFGQLCTDDALPAVAAASFSRFSRVEPPAPGGSHPRRPQMQKSLLIEQAFRIWSVIEDDSPLRGSPCGPLLTQRSLASLESNLPAPGGSHPHGLQMQKSLLAEQAFRIWSVIEDSNLRPLRPERSALPGCANHRMRGASYCWDAYPSMPYFQKIAQPARNSAA